MSTAAEAGFSRYTFNMKWLSKGNFESGMQVVVSYISPEQLKHRVLGWKLIGSSWNFAKLSPNTDHLSFDWSEEGMKSLQSESIENSHHRYIIVGNGHSEPIGLVYRFSGAWMVGFPPGFIQSETPLIQWIKCLRI